MLRRGNDTLSRANATKVRPWLCLQASHWRTDLQFYILGLTGLVTRLFQLGVTAIAPHRLSQNRLEGLFGSLRHRSGGSINAAQVLYLLQRQRHAIITSNELASPVYFNLDGQRH